jgi:hypothetical protein
LILIVKKIISRDYPKADKTANLIKI